MAKKTADIAYVIKHKKEDLYLDEETECTLDIADIRRTNWFSSKKDALQFILNKAKMYETDQFWKDAVVVPVRISRTRGLSVYESFESEPELAEEWKRVQEARKHYFYYLVDVNMNVSIRRNETLIGVICSENLANLAYVCDPDKMVHWTRPGWCDDRIEKLDQLLKEFDEKNPDLFTEEMKRIPNILY